MSTSMHVVSNLTDVYAELVRLQGQSQLEFIKRTKKTNLTRPSLNEIPSFTPLDYVNVLDFYITGLGRFKEILLVYKHRQLIVSNFQWYKTFKLKLANYNIKSGFKFLLTGNLYLTLYFNVLFNLKYKFAIFCFE